MLKRRYANGLVTHFEPCDSRRAFPCIDSPSIKAPFTVRFLFLFPVFICISLLNQIAKQIDMIVPSDYDVVSNMPVASIEENTTFSIVPAVAEKKEEEAVESEKETEGEAEEEEEKEEDREVMTHKRVVFQPTPPTSSYLVCFVLGKFDFIEDSVTLDLNACVTFVLSLLLSWRK